MILFAIDSIRQISLNLVKNGKILFKHYQEEEKIQKLLSLGDISSLAESIACPKEHSFDNRITGYSVFYNRDRGEIGVESETHQENEFPDYGQDYEYLFKDGKWHYRESYSKEPFMELTLEVIEND